MKKDSKLTDEEIEEKLKHYTSSSLPNTKNYLIDKLKENPNFKDKRGILLKEDLIEQYKLSRRAMGLSSIPSYDFSAVPDILKNRQDCFTLKFTDSEGNIRSYVTNYKYLIIGGQDSFYYRKLRKNGKAITKDIFIEQAEKVHGKGRYLYDKVNFINTKTKVMIFCTVCNEYFWQTPSDHVYSKAGCPKCGNKANSEKRAKGIEAFIKKSKEKFGENALNYDNAVYKNSDTKLELTCNRCGTSFQVTPYSHLRSEFGCPCCAMRLRGSTILTQEEFQKRAEKALGDTYDFSNSVYTGLKNKVEVYDKDLDMFFFRKPVDLFSGRGNPARPRNGKSKGEIAIENSLLNLGISYESQRVIKKQEFDDMFIDCRRDMVFLDFFVENYKGTTYVIEYNGEQHYKYNSHFHKQPQDYYNQVKRDQAVFLYCSQLDYVYIEIPYFISINKIKDGLDAIINRGECIENYFPCTTPSFVDFPLDIS